MIATLRWLHGPILWATHFLVVYASESLLCSRGGGADGHRLLVAAVSACVLAALVAGILLDLRRIRAGADRGRDGAAFMDRVALVLAVGSVGAVIWTMLPGLIIPACLPPA